MYNPIEIATGWWFGTSISYCSIYIGENHPNWRSHIFSEGGVGQPPTKAILLMVNLGMVYDGFWWFMINFLNSIYQFADQVLQL